MATETSASRALPFPGTGPQIIASKLVVPLPLPRRGTVRRARILRAIGTASDRRLLSLVAPPGYGKTRLLAQLAGAEPRSVAWLTADDSESDPVSLLTYIAAALGQVRPVDPALFDAIAAPSASPRAMVGRLLSLMGSSDTPVALVIDDAHRIRGQASLDALAELVTHLPSGCLVALASREPVGLPIARWRAEDWVLELGRDELAMDDEEAGALLASLGTHLGDAEVKELNRRTEGWPALLALAGLAADRHPPVAPAGQAHVDPTVADYLRSELLQARTDDELRFLTRTSILERMSGPLCDAVVGSDGPPSLLEGLARSTLLVDEYGGWYRYHSLLREVLHDELAAREPASPPELHRRASEWFEAAGELDAAIEHAFAAGDIDRAAVLAGRALSRYHWSGRRDTIRRWLTRFQDEDLLQRPWLAVLAAWETLTPGDPAATERFADLADRASFDGRPPDGTASFESGRLLLRACMVRGGADAALRDAARAVELEPLGSPWRAMATWMLALARLTLGDIAGADAALEEGVVAAAAVSYPALEYCLLGHRGLLAVERHDWATADAFLAQANALRVGQLVDGYLSVVPIRILEIRLAIHHGQVGVARQLAARAAGLRPMLTWSAPGAAVLFLLGLARAHLALSDAAGASTLLAQASGVIRRRPLLGVLPDEVVALRTSIRDHAVGSRVSTLTTAELRVLAMLPYYLSFKEIAQRLGVSESTIKTHAMSIYGKLEANSRSEAIEHAVSAGLLEAFLPPDGRPSPVPVDASERRG